MSRLLSNGPEDAATLVLAHGSGAPMDSVFMNEFSRLAGEQSIRVIRFEFAYMAGRRITGKKPPPPKAEKLMDEFLAIIGEFDDGPVFIGGKSLGGRVASMIAQKCFDEKKIAGLVCLGYPFHPPGKPENLRTAHFTNFSCPTLICQGENDPFGKRVEIEGYELPEALQFHWAAFGNHDLSPPKRSGLTAQDNWSDAARAVARFMKSQAL